MTKPKVRPLEGVSIVFDLDGTLVNTAPDLHATLNHILKTNGYELVLKEVSQGLIGIGAKAMLRAGLADQGSTIDEVEIDAMFEGFLSHYADNIDTYSLPFPGCVDCLNRLREAGAILSVCTNKRQNLADQLLASLGLSKHFAAIFGSDSVPAPKPDSGHIFATLEAANGDRDCAIMVGDSQTDERAAHNAGLPFIFVPFGYGPISADSSTRHTLEHFDHLTAELVMEIISA